MSKYYIPLIIDLFIGYKENYWSVDNMNKDYKLMAALIPIILILGLALYIFPNASGLKTDIASPLMNQTDNSTLNQTYNNTTIQNQPDSINTQNSQVATNTNNYYPTNNPTNSVTPTDNTTGVDPNIPVEPIEPTNNSIP